MYMCICHAGQVYSYVPKRWRLEPKGQSEGGWTRSKEPVGTEGKPASVSPTSGLIQTLEGGVLTKRSSRIASRKDVGEGRYRTSSSMNLYTCTCTCTCMPTMTCMVMLIYTYSCYMYILHVHLRTCSISIYIMAQLRLTIEAGLSQPHTLHTTTIQQHNNNNRHLQKTKQNSIQQT